jgi:hypothetical protein
MSYNRPTPENTAVLVVDHQTGLSNAVQDSPLYNNAAGSFLAAKGKN